MPIGPKILQEPSDIQKDIFIETKTKEPTSVPNEISINSSDHHPCKIYSPVKITPKK